ncbi:MAG: hypothetical protein JHC40_05575, partial [Burkholderiales bacterium]|nr:hypothetical protein [Burkholderiales bacterium]
MNPDHNHPRPRRSPLLPCLGAILGVLFAGMASAQEVLPFPPTPSGSKAGLTMQTSTYKKRVEPQRLAKG